jgi:tetratricopeptide (TPR) repeat protein
LAPDYEDAFYDRGYCYGQIGNYQLAIADFSAAIRLNPNSADAYYYRGVAYQKMGNSDQAAADRATASHLAPHLLDRRRSAPTATTS